MAISDTTLHQGLPTLHVANPDLVPEAAAVKDSPDVRCGLEHPPVEPIGHGTVRHAILICRCGASLDAAFTEAFTAGQVDMREQIVEFLLRIDEADVATLVETNVYV